VNFRHLKVTCSLEEFGPTEKAKKVDQQDGGQHAEVLFSHKSCLSFVADDKISSYFRGYIAARL
jgi:hypothetical protein